MPRHWENVILCSFFLCCIGILDIFARSLDSLPHFPTCLDLACFVALQEYSIFNYSQLVSRSSHKCQIELRSIVVGKKKGKSFPFSLDNCITGLCLKVEEEFRDKQRWEPQCPRVFTSLVPTGEILLARHKV